MYDQRLPDVHPQWDPIRSTCRGQEASRKLVIVQPPFVTTRPSTFARRPGALLAFVFGLLLAGCSVLLIAPYDATTDRLLTDLTVLTETVVVKADNDQLSVGEQEKFYAEAEGTVSAMKMRAGLYAKNELEIAALDELAKRYSCSRRYQRRLGRRRESP